MSSVVKSLRESHEKHLEVLGKTKETVHAETLLFRQLEYKDGFVRGHFINNHARREFLAGLDKLRKLVPSLMAVMPESEE